ncbi:DinB family protein [Priestia aryabhattai]
MKSIYMKLYFEELYEQRFIFSKKIVNYNNIFWVRPSENKWSLGETYYHLYLMVRRFRQLNKFYLPVSRRIASARKDIIYKTSSKNIYTEYTEKHRASMKAPFILVPPKKIRGSITFFDLKNKIEEETKQLENMVSHIEDNIAGHIRYLDPIAHNPNLIQSIHLLAIHEEHHFSLCTQYYNIV